MMCDPVANDKFQWGGYFYKKSSTNNVWVAYNATNLIMVIAPKIGSIILQIVAIYIVKLDPIKTKEGDLTIKISHIGF